MKRLAEQTLYEILEIPRDATADEVERAYDRAKSLYGPGALATYTLMEPDEAALLARRIEEARAVLLDPVMRAAYDAGLPPERVRDQPSGRPLPPVIPPVKTAPAAERLAPVEPPPPASLPVAVAPVVAPTREPVAPVSAVPAAVGGPVPPSEGQTPAVATRPAEPPVAASATAPRPEPARAAPPPLPAYSIPEGPWTGEVLRRVRESRGLTLPQLSERTKVTRHHLENIEADRYGKLPAAVYLRGILMSLAKELRLDGQKVARSYLEQVAASQTPPTPSKGR